MKSHAIAILHSYSFLFCCLFSCSRNRETENRLNSAEELMSEHPDPDETAEALGTVEDSIYDLIIGELEVNHAWRKVRDSKSCRNCIYRWLCPSPYERAAGRETICTLK